MFGTAFATRGFALPDWKNVSSGGGITGSAAATLANFVGVAAGTVAVAGAASLVLGVFAGVAAGAVAVRGASALTFASFGGAAAGAVTTPGDGGAAVAVVVLALSARGGLTLGAADQLVIAGRGVLTI